MVVADAGGDSMDRVFLVLVWSLYWLYQGVHPDRDPDGRKYVDIDPTGSDALRALTPLADGLFCCLWVIRMDLEYVVKRLHVASYRRQDCALCPAGHRACLPWTDCRSDAAWIGRIWDRDSWRVAFPRPHRLFRHLPGVKIAMFIPDILHTKFIGVDAYVLGSILQYLYIYLIDGGADEALAYVFELVRQAYDKLGIHRDRFACLKPTSIKSDSAKLPFLKGSGGQVKKLMAAMAIVFRRITDNPRYRNAPPGVDPTNNLHATIAYMIDESLNINTILEQHAAAYRMEPPHCHHFRDACFEYCKAITACCNLCHPRAPLFHFTLKSHYLLHLGVIARYVCPCLGDCSEGEDLMKVAKRLIASSARSNTFAGSCKTAMSKYCRALGFDLSRDGKWWQP